ncbi:hypothetical protein NQ315_000918 [Exocentrus adspersus]|uniref:TIL domain-containing protein n=1 Tax=Exocentrus adspersus TaxID=1586481 RepID=A0AAV8WF37_9CUCU|nr:hypothetical protein NQ315_000918 [Exocentrus adspersus]
MKATLVCTLFSLLVLAAVFSTSQAAAASDCEDPNAFYNTCGSACPPSCQKKQTGCIDVCVPSCACKADYIFDEDTEKCVEKTSC